MKTTLFEMVFIIREKMPDISADPDLLDREAKRLKQIGGEIDLVSNNVGKIIRELPNGWQSDYSSEFSNELNAQKRNIHNGASTSRSLAGLLHKIAEEIRELERELSH